MKVFLDVGSNRGQTLGAILDPKYEFDRIHCFEPVPELQQVIAVKYRDPRIFINRVGLWKETCEKLVFSAGSQSGSIFADKVNVDPRHSALCQFVRASDWFREHLKDTDDVYLKLNCEGAEVDIIEDLLDSDEYRKIKSVGVAFDVRKIPSQRDRELEIKRRLHEAGYENYVDIDLKPDDSLKETIQGWLSIAGANQPSLGNRIRQVAYSCQTFGERVARYSRRRLYGS